MNPTEAYAEVYIKDPAKASTRGMASELRSKPIVTARIKELQEEIAKEAVFSAREILLMLKKLVMFDPRKLFKEDGSPKAISELDDETAFAIQGLDVLEEFDYEGDQKVLIGHTKKYKLADRNAAIEKAMRHLCLFPNKLEVSGNLTLEQLIMKSKEEPEK